MSLKWDNPRHSDLKIVNRGDSVNDLISSDADKWALIDLLNLVSDLFRSTTVVNCAERHV